MALEKQKKLRKIEFIFTEGNVNPVCHCEYNIVIIEDDREIQSKKHRENISVNEAKKMINP